MQKMRESDKQKKLAFILAFFVLLSDQLSKYVVVKCLDIGDSVSVLSFFNITRVANKGISFGMLSNVIQPIVLVLISLLIVFGVFIWTKKNMSYILPSCLIISGAIGNIIDRVIDKAVIDFLDFHIYGYHWPAFNIADTSIVIGVCILFFVSYVEEKL